MTNRRVSNTITSEVGNLNINAYLFDLNIKYPINFSICYIVIVLKAYTNKES